MQWNYRCCSRDYNYSRRQQNYVLHLPVPDDTMNISLNTLFTIAEEWDMPSGFLYHTCGGQMKQREKLYSASEVIVVALKIFAFSDDGAFQKKVIQVSHVQDSAITVN